MQSKSHQFLKPLLSVVAAAGVLLPGAQGGELGKNPYRMHTKDTADAPAKREQPALQKILPVDEIEVRKFIAEGMGEDFNPLTATKAELAEYEARKAAAFEGTEARVPQIDTDYAATPVPQ